MLCFMEFTVLSNYVVLLAFVFQISTLKEYQQIMRKIRTFYFGDAAIDKSTQKQYIDLWTDVNFVYGIDKSAKQHAAKSNLKTFYSR